MAKYLVIVESPAKTKTIQKYLNSNYKVEASMGHIRDLPKSVLGIDIDNDFEPHYINIRGKGDLIKKLKSDVKNADKIYLATDPDREGEAISWHLKTALGLDDGKKYSRIEFHEITESAIKNAIKNARDIDENLVDAQQARRALDRIVGYQISPLLWRKVSKGLSAGRVQSVALRIVCDREELIEKFNPEEYWTIDASLDSKGDQFNAKFVSKNGNKFPIGSKTEAQTLVGELKKNDFVVSSIQRGERSRNPLMPFKTSTLQQAAFSKLGFGTRKTMQIAQQLYEGIEIKKVGLVGLITYMRTDSTRLSDEFKASAANYIENKYGKEYLGNFNRVEKMRADVQDAHEGIRVTDLSLEPDSIKDNLTNDQYKLYKLVYDRAVASLMAPVVYNTLSVDIKNGDYQFKATGSNLKFAGFMKCYDIDKEDDENVKIPDNLTEGQKLDLIELIDKQHFTEPPARFTEATLVKELEENGIGRPSTYATIISTIIDRRYIDKEEKKLMPTELGMIVNELMCKYFTDIVSTSFTADIEKQLDEIAAGEKNWKDTMSEFYADFKPLLENADKNIEKVELKEEESGDICEKCGRPMVIRHGKFGNFIACPGFPECRNVKSLVVKAGTHCPICGDDVVVKKSKKGRTFYTCIKGQDVCDFISWDKPLDEKCPKCGKELYEVGMKNKRIVCQNPECEEGIKHHAKEEAPIKAKKKTTTTKKTTAKKTTTKKKTTAKKTTKK